jgi:hypothetical protein
MTILVEGFVKKSGSAKVVQKLALSDRDCIDLWIDLWLDYGIDFGIDFGIDLGI